MKKLIFMLGLVLVVVLWAEPVQAAGVDNFIITRYEVTLQLGRDSENRSTLKTTETITADFPPNQNRGLARSFVKEYDGHSTDFNLLSVTDETGKTLEYSWNENELRIGNANSYVSGEKTYVITYTQRDVTRYYNDTKKDEFYWDAIGVQWRVPIQNVTVKLEVDNALINNIETSLQCYTGSSGQSNSCGEIVKTDNKHSVDVKSLQPGQGVSVAIGFQANTFSIYQQPLWEKIFAIWSTAQIFLVVPTILATILIWMRHQNISGRKKELNPIVPEYLPPKSSVTTSAMLVGRYGTVKGSIMTAQLLDLAVRHFIKIYQVKEKTIFQAAEYEIEIIKDISALKLEEQELLTDMFDGTPSVGSRMNLRQIQNNIGYMLRTKDNDDKINKLLENDYSLLEENTAHKTQLRRFVKFFVVIGIILVSPVLLIAALVIFVFSTNKSLTDEGLSLRRYLEGLKMYISVAETDRIKMLQSPDSILKVSEAGIDSVQDQRQLVKLYEQTLPYAVLFGQEKEWSKQIGSYYENVSEQPDWYSGANGFNAAMFIAGINGLDTAAVSASSYASSSGGSSGGGSAGGGGGGGGGGGW